MTPSRPFRSPPPWLRFVQLDGFERVWRQMGLGDEDLRVLEGVVLEGPRDAPVVAGTGGVRKLRFAPPSQRRGTSGALRVYYTYFEQDGLVVLIFAHEKNVMETISESYKSRLRDVVREIEEHLKQVRARKRT